MLNNLIILILRIYLLFLLIELVMFSIKCRRNNKVNNVLSPAKGVHLLCSVLSIVITMALYLNYVDYNDSIIWFYIIFGIATIISIPLMLWVIFWRIEYNEEMIRYRNLIGARKKYSIKEVYLIERNQFTEIMNDNKKITDYNIMLYNIEDVKKFETFINSKGK
ncbi:MAG: hypothetical protein IKJ16_06860 [Agathobacter sp.]|nr:hypothetical protein [Agathobacter sp.]